MRAGDIIGRIRALHQECSPAEGELEINPAVLEVIALTRSEAFKNSVSVRTQLAEGLPAVQADRVQLQQVVLNLIVNAIEAMAAVGEGERELLISTGRDASDGVHVTLRDSGPGLDPKNVERLFEAFYTTKPTGMGDGPRHLPLDHRGAWRTDVGRRKRASGRRVSVHLASRVMT